MSLILRTLTDGELEARIYCEVAHCRPINSAMALELYVRWQREYSRVLARDATRTGVHDGLGKLESELRASVARADAVLNDVYTALDRAHNSVAELRDKAVELLEELGDAINDEGNTQ